ncbi:MAG: KpsF/GutQ family sugar-phosphate isomerase [Bacteroidetes bacterium]|nr:KpsF/GutQ family sugar-phosphate isomerase [Bacteroidota bacterium]
MNSQSLIVKTALRTLEIEAETISNLKASIDNDFNAAVEAIFHSNGRVIVSGIGKSAIISKKIVATLNSTGTAAIFMHAADAIHGDIGMIQKDDVILCLSKSGNTPEIKVLVPLLKSFGSLLIGMVGKRDSYLGKQANHILYTPVPLEADPNNLAPTASTTAQIVMGDALATSLLALRGFSPQDFAQFHPGGVLGKQLYLRVRDIYPQNEKPTVHPNENIRNTILEMTSKRLGATVVADDTGKVQGIITDGDLRRMLELERDIPRLQARDVMTHNPKTIDKDTLAVKAFSTMRSKSITQLIVLDDDRYVGIIHLHDLIREGII